MTVENCLKHLKAYKEHANDESLKGAIRKQSQANFENMKTHILSSAARGGKFKGHQIVDVLTKKEVKEIREVLPLVKDIPKEEPKEVKKKRGKKNAKNRKR